MNKQLSQVTEKVACTIEVTLIETKEQLELKQQKVKELQSILRDKENEINFLKEVLAARAHLVRNQNNTISALQKSLADLKENTDPPVIVMKSYLPEIIEKSISETAV